MSEELAQAYRMIQEQGQQIARMAQLLESQIAMREAHNTLAQALMPFFQDNQEFKRILTEIHQVRLAHHLSHDVSNFFIQSYTENLNAMLPSDLRFPIPSVELGQLKKS